MVMCGVATTTLRLGYAIFSDLDEGRIHKILIQSTKYKDSSRVAILAQGRRGGSTEMSPSPGLVSLLCA